MGVRNRRDPIRSGPEVAPDQGRRLAR